MPGMITHYFCAKTVMAALPADIRGRLAEHGRMYNIGSQGPDIFFYDFPGLLGRRRGIGSRMHQKQVGEFIGEMAREAGRLAEPVRGAAFAYIAGYLTHYCLDCAAHPYVYYKTGFRKPGERRGGLRYSAYHRSFETSIDVLMLKLLAGKRPADEKFWRLIFTKNGKTRQVADFLGGCISRVYGARVNGRQVFAAMRWMWRTTRILQSTRGRRKRLMELAEDVIIGGRVCSCMIHPQQTDGLDYLNTKNTPWKMPWDENSISCCSFTELFDNACNTAKPLISALYDYAYNNGSLADFTALAGNRSLKSGMDDCANVEFRFHDIIYK